MQHPAKKFSILMTTVLTAALCACGADKAEVQQSQPASSQPTNNVAAPATQEAPADNKAAVVQEPTVPKDAADAADAVSPAGVPDVKTVSSKLSIEEGKKRYEQTCKVCHDQGLLDAPKLSDKAEWAKRLEKGVDTLYEHSAKGFNKMPAQAVSTVTEAEVYAAVDYMLEQAK